MLLHFQTYFLSFSQLLPDNNGLVSLAYGLISHLSSLQDENQCIPNNNILKIVYINCI